MEKYWKKHYRKKKKSHFLLCPRPPQKKDEKKVQHSFSRPLLLWCDIFCTQSLYNIRTLWGQRVYKCAFNIVFKSFFTRFFAVVAQHHRCQKYVRKIRLSSKKNNINRLMIVQISRVIVGACLSTYTITYETTTQHKVF